MLRAESEPVENGALAGAQEVVSISCGGQDLICLRAGSG